MWFTWYTPPLPIPKRISSPVPPILFQSWVMSFFTFNIFFEVNYLVIKLKMMSTF